MGASSVSAGWHRCGLVNMSWEGKSLKRRSYRTAGNRLCPPFPFPHGLYHVVSCNLQNNPVKWALGFTFYLRGSKGERTQMIFFLRLILLIWSPFGNPGEWKVFLRSASFLGEKPRHPAWKSWLKCCTVILLYVLGLYSLLTWQTWSALSLV